jgi:hypothetical protein
MQPGTRCVAFVLCGAPRSTGAAWGGLARALSAASGPTSVVAPAAADGARPWRVSPVDPSKFLYERTVRECYKNLALLGSAGRPIRAGLFHRLLTKCVQCVRVC